MTRLLLCFTFLLGSYPSVFAQIDSLLFVYTVNPQIADLQFFHEDDAGKVYGSFERLNQALSEEGKRLTFGMNGGMFQKNLTPLGLYIEDGVTLKPLNTVQEAYGNFYLQPNGVFYLTNEKVADICTSQDFRNSGNVKFATQSGPMLIVDGAIHGSFNPNSKNVHIRNGVGILPNGELIFAISKVPVNLYDFAYFFRSQGCQNALYLDGFVSRMYLPEQDILQDGVFGIILGIVE